VIVYWLDDWGYISGRCRGFSVRHYNQTGAGAHLTPYPVGTVALSPRIKELEREAHHSTPSNADFKNLLFFTVTSRYVFMM
jgi:hypothetical protein